MFKHETSIKLHQTDAAGLLFFGHQFTLIHDTYELFMDSIGFQFARILKEADYMVPIVHAEADCKKPLYVSERVTTSLKVKTIGQSSYLLEYELVNREGELVGTGQTVHVCVDRETGKKRDLPQKLREKLNS